MSSVYPSLALLPGDINLHSGAAVAGVLTWVVFNRLGSVRGDYAAAFYSFVVTAAYASLGYFGVPPSQSIHLILAVATTYAISALFTTVAYRLGPWHPLAKYPGPRWWWITSLKLAQVSYMGKRHFILDDLHKKYGPYMRIGPDTVSINTLSAVKMYQSGGTKGHLTKPESYNTPGHMDRMALFFKNPRDLHKERKAIWSAAFTGTAYVTSI